MVWSLSLSFPIWTRGLALLPKGKVTTHPFTLFCDYAALTSMLISLLQAAMTLLSRSLHPEHPSPPTSSLPLSHPCGSAQRLPPQETFLGPRVDQRASLPTSGLCTLWPSLQMSPGARRVSATPRGLRVASVPGTRPAGRGHCEQVCPPLDRRTQVSVGFLILFHHPPPPSHTAQYSSHWLHVAIHI